MKNKILIIGIASLCLFSGCKYKSLSDVIIPYTMLYNAPTELTINNSNYGTNYSYYFIKRNSYFISIDVRKNLFGYYVYSEYIKKDGIITYENKHNIISYKSITIEKDYTND